MSITFKPPGAFAQFEAGSPGEALAIMQDDPKWAEWVAFCNAVATTLPVVNDAPDVIESEMTPEQPAKKRGRRSNAEIAAAKVAEEAAGAEAAKKAAAPAPAPAPVAPAPVPVPTMTPLANPSAADAQPALLPAVPNPGTGPDKLGIPPFLARTAETTAAPVLACTPETTAAPPLPLPPLPAAAPNPPPPLCVLGPKIIANLKERVGANAEGGQAMANWLADCGVCVKGASFEEVLAVLQFTEDTKLTGVASQLGVA